MTKMLYDAYNNNMKGICIIFYLFFLFLFSLRLWRMLHPGCQGYCLPLLQSGSVAQAHQTPMAQHKWLMQQILLLKMKPVRLQWLHSHQQSAWDTAHLGPPTASMRPKKYVMFTSALILSLLLWIIEFKYLNIHVIAGSLLHKQHGRNRAPIPCL